MSYNELIKNFDKIRDYMREFYVYGFKSRDEYNKKSGRSYDDERRRLESWLGEYMKFRQTADGKNVFISINSRETGHNPLFKAWKAKSFTDGDITLHFILMDILASSTEGIALKEITSQIDGYLSSFDAPKTFDESTVRKKLKEYVSEGILHTEKVGKTLLYRRCPDVELCGNDVLDFFAETMPCGVVGSFILEKKEEHDDVFAFKHHYITGALDGEIVYQLFEAMGGRKMITMETINRYRDYVKENHVVPLRIMISVQSGRQHLMAYTPRLNRITSFRIDSIVSVKLDEECKRFDELRDKLDGMHKHMWGVSTQGRSGQRMEHVDFTICFTDDEPFIYERLLRERRCGLVEKIDGNTARFSTDVFDASELIPWIRTFISRITEIHFSDKDTERQFRQDLKDMYAMYGLEGGEGA